MGGDRVFRGWPRVFMTSNIVEENAADPWADINGTVISVAVLPDCFRRPSRFVLRNEYSRVEEFFCR